MKTRQISFISFMIIFFLLGIYTGNKIHFIGFFTLLFMFAASILTNLFTLFTFKYTQELTPSTGIKGNIVEFKIRIYNDKPFPFPYVKVYYTSPETLDNSQEKSMVLSILPGKYGEIHERIVCTYWGKHSLGMNKVEVRDMFGLLTFTININRLSYYKKQTLVVYPRILPLRHLPIPLLEQDGQINQALSISEDPSSTSDIRSYHYGDPLKRIHWKLSIRKQDLLVKIYEEASQPNALLFMDCAPTKSSGITGIQIEDRVVECTTAIIHYILSKWLPLSMITYTKERQELKGKKPSDFQKFYNFLSELSFDSNFAMEDILFFETNQLKNIANILMVAHQITEKLLNILLLLKNVGTDIILLLILPAEDKSSDLDKMVDALTEKGIRTLAITPQDDFVERMDIFS